MQSINLYKVGDTLIFQNNRMDIDSITIVNKEIKYNGLSEGYSGNPQTCWIYYQTIPPNKPRLVSFGGRQGKVYSQKNLFLSMTKWDKNKPARMEIKYGGFRGSLPHTNSIKNNKKHGDHFNLLHNCYDCNGVDSTDIVKIIWTPKKGIVEYMKKNNTVYQLIN